MLAKMTRTIKYGKHVNKKFSFEANSSHVGRNAAAAFGSKTLIFAIRLMF